MTPPTIVDIASTNPQPGVQVKSFQPFRLDETDQCLWRGDARLSLTPKPFAILRYLVEQQDTSISLQKWKDSDPDVPLLLEARQEYEQLSSLMNKSSANTGLKGQQ